ncbi:MAG: hypothetical protein AAF567_22755 [Actinomycetota bacterium]
MTATATPAPHTLTEGVAWRPFPGFDGLYYWVVTVDRDRAVVDMLMKFDPGAKCVPHRHVGPTRTLVLEGEHILYEPHDDSIETARKGPGDVGDNGGDEQHIEGGGPYGAVILLTMTAVDDVVYEIFDEALTLQRTITLEDFERGLRKQQAG